MLILKDSFFSLISSSSVLELQWFFFKSLSCEQLGIGKQNWFLSCSSIITNNKDLRLNYALPRWFQYSGIKSFTYNFLCLVLYIWSTPCHTYRTKFIYSLAIQLSSLKHSVIPRHSSALQQAFQVSFESTELDKLVTLEMHVLFSNTIILPSIFSS